MERLTLTVYVRDVDPARVDPEDVANDILGAYDEWLRVNEAEYAVGSRALEARWEPRQNAKLVAKVDRGSGRPTVFE